MLIRWEEASIPGDSGLPGLCSQQALTQCSGLQSAPSMGGSAPPGAMALGHGDGQCSEVCMCLPRVLARRALKASKDPLDLLLCYLIVFPQDPNSGNLVKGSTGLLLWVGNVCETQEK